MAEADASGNAPATENAGTPPAGEQTPSQPAVEETATLKKTELSELQKKAAQASEAQSRADKLEKELRETKRGFKRKVVDSENFKPEEILEVKSKVAARLITSDKYRDLVSKKPELTRILGKNPLDLLEANEFIDAEDAADQVFDYLDTLAETPVAPPPATPLKEEPPTAPINPNPATAETKTPEQAKAEQDAKLPLMDRMVSKIAGRVQIKQ